VSVEHRFLIALCRLYHAFLAFPETPSMSTPQELFTTVTSDDASVVADKAKLDADTTAAVSAHSGLQAAVTAPTLVTNSDGSFVALLPQPDGTLQAITLVDGSKPATPPATGP
jgi:hypothetical protein